MQGEWRPKQIDNPDYKGAWVHPEIDNPEYTHDATMYKFDNIGVLGLDLWQVMIITHPLRAVISEVPGLSIHSDLLCGNINVKLSPNKKREM